MKTQVALPVVQTNVFAAIRSAVLNCQVMLTLAALFSSMLEEKVSTTQVFHLLHANVALTAVLLFGGVSLLVACLLVAWFVGAAWQCKRSFASRR